MAAKKKKRITTLPVTIEVDHRGAFITRQDGTRKEQLDDFKRRYLSKSGMPNGVIAAAVVDIAAKKVVSTIRGPMDLTQGKPTTL